MELSIENKAKFFAQYWGQNLLKYANHTISSEVGVNVLDITRNNLKYAFLILKPLSSITHEDFTFIMWKQFPFQPTFKKNKIYEGHLNVNQSDYLRSKGYAIRFMGLSVEQMVESGWIKLKEG